jgi:hypothetical protein
VESIAGDIPVIIIFTKFDTLVAKYRAKMWNRALSQPMSQVQINKEVEDSALSDFTRIYREPLDKLLEGCSRNVVVTRLGDLQPEKDGGIPRG